MRHATSLSRVYRLSALRDRYRCYSSLYSSTPSGRRCRQHDQQGHRVCSSAVNYARKEWGWQLVNPVAGIRLKEPAGRVRWLSRGDAKALISAARDLPRAPHLLDFIRLALHTGMRKGELLGLEWRRVDLHRNLVYLDAQHIKTRRRRSIPLNAEARRSLFNRARFRAKQCPESPWVFCHTHGQRIQDVGTLVQDIS